MDRAAPETGRQWSDTDSRRDERELKHRAVGETRRVPIPPVLVAILRDHLKRHGTDREGRLFRGERGGVLAGVTYTRMWDRARAAALTEEQYTSPLGRRPYDLRHAAVSTWLNSGVAPTQVAEWAGHSVDVLLKIYAKCIDGQEDCPPTMLGPGRCAHCPGAERLAEGTLTRRGGRMGRGSPWARHEDEDGSSRRT